MTTVKRKIEDGPISTFCLPQISETDNLKYEQLYLQSQAKKAKPGPQDKGHRQPNPNLVRKPKRKVALLMSYCGTGYQGMQINPDVPSIELDLHKAFAASGAVSEENAMDPNKSSFMRCARTDKGVHAAGQIVSMKMILEDPDIIAKINEKLPKQIRVWGYCRVNNSFHAKNRCDSRIYEYLLPTYCLSDVDPTLYPYSTVGREADVPLKAPDFEPRLIPLPSKEKMAKLKAYRIDAVDAEKLSKLVENLQFFVGTRNHHNFTVGKDFKDKSSQRFIKSFTVGEPFVKNGREWVSLKVHGQAFMIHQIRKMVGIAVMMVRTKTPLKLLSNCFSEQRLNVPKAPGLGLLLERPVFDQYNEHTKDREELPPIDFDKYKVIIANQTEIDQFKQEWIYDAMMKEEDDKNVFEEWMRIIDSCSDDYAWYLNSDGQIDDSRKPPDLFKKGVNTGRMIPTAGGPDEEDGGESD